MEEINDPQVLLFIGPRQAGKTTILKQIKNLLEQKFQETFFIDLEDPDYFTPLNESPKNLLKFLSCEDQKKTYVFIDEIQYLDDPSKFLKYLYDHHNENIKLIASGSSAFYIDKKFKDSLAGRKKLYEVRTLNFREFLKFRNQEQLMKLDFTKLNKIQERELSNLFHEYMVWGGYPAVVLENELEKKKLLLREYAYSYIKKDLYESGIRDEKNFYRLTKLLADQCGDLVNSSELANTLGISQPSIDNYLHLLQKSFHISLIRPFHSNIRKEITKMPKVYFGDLGLRNFFMANFEPWLTRKDKGKILENSFFRILIENHFADEINFWRINEENEVDFVIKSKAAFELKSSYKSINVKKYKNFTELYPDLNLSFVSIDLEQKAKQGFSCQNIWELIDAKI